MTQTEEVQFKLDGLILLTEGIGRAKADGKPILNALAIVSYDDGTGAYQMRAFNDGRFLETEVKLLENGKGITWGFTMGQNQDQLCHANNRERRLDGAARDHDWVTTAEEVHGN